MWIRESRPGDGEVLLDICLRCVRETHLFVTESDIQDLLPAVRHYLSATNPDLWTLCSDESVPIAFIGLADDNVEALFEAPEHARRGAGRLLVEHARRLKGPLRVDVNEQDPEALKFYEANGFHVVGRSPVDSEGRPFPLLHLREVVT